jgi:hypothetical protein
LCGYREAATSRVILLPLEFSAQGIQCLLMNDVKLFRETIEPVRRFDADALKFASYRRSEDLPLSPCGAKQAGNYPVCPPYPHGERC